MDLRSRVSSRRRWKRKAPFAHAARPSEVVLCMACSACVGEVSGA